MIPNKNNYIPSTALHCTGKIFFSPQNWQILLFCHSVCNSDSVSRPDRTSPPCLPLPSLPHPPPQNVVSVGLWTFEWFKKAWSLNYENWPKD